jgi:hypothetical protein
LDRRVGFAAPSEESALGELMAPFGLGWPDAVTELLVLRAGRENAPVAAARLDEWQAGRFYLPVICAAAAGGGGFGGALLREILHNPWRCARQKEPLPRPAFEITTVARGAARGFYAKHGFTPCAFARVPEPFREQCDGCPQAAVCDSQPMVYEAGG